MPTVLRKQFRRQTVKIARLDPVGIHMIPYELIRRPSAKLHPLEVALAQDDFAMLYHEILKT
jgi:hypothetical protein